MFPVFGFGAELPFSQRVRKENLKYFKNLILTLDIIQAHAVDKHNFTCIALMADSPPEALQIVVSTWSTNTS